jgi:hypothetical protein
MKVIRIISLLCILVLIECGEEALEVSITSPLNGSLVNGILKVMADATDNAVCVSFYINDSRAHVAGMAPFVYVWNTFVLADSSSHTIYAIAEDSKGNEVMSDSIWVMIDNGNMIFADDFESYLPATYPHAGWFEIWMGAGSDHTYVDPDVACNGLQSFRLRGLADWVRTDGVELALGDIARLTYQTSLMIPSSEPTGALFGFFLLLDPQLGTIYNGILFCHDDSLVYARGFAVDNTGRMWSYDTWYNVKITLDYAQLRMSVWLDDEQIVFDLPAVPRDWTDTFALATEYGSAGMVYYDDVKIFESE